MTKQELDAFREQYKKDFLHSTDAFDEDRFILWLIHHYQSFEKKMKHSLSSKWNPYGFDRHTYLEFTEYFEARTIDNVQPEIDEFNNDIEDMAFDLAYLRYRVALSEQLLQEALPHIECTTHEQSNVITAIGTFLTRNKAD